ncbi:YfgM family protein [Thorsellia anophelis]|uniref:Ancillary SecYEG translocon subunit n=1 Tax=Thorsellia anophelis DSM 18579 TaxID=1123402 RepID=A0A1H9Y3L5_9GAMM|nr:tetratricopeptide repeat protein [Thorsellia anophelis]SES63399.1 Putative negative regulator of RcsB-dependent stress response [Thorsellia anophelis DSM 18579]
MQTDNEQYEQVKTFIRENWIAITAGVVIGVGGLLGWRYYQEYQIESQLNEASAYFNATSALNKLNEAIEATPENAESLNQEADNAIKTYLATDSSNYAGIAALKLAKNLASQKKYTEAEQVLIDIASKVKDENILATILFMLANIQAEQDKFADALATIEKITLASWNANLLEFKADILKRKGDISEAKKVYEQAITVADPSLQDYLRLKLNNLPS